MPRGNWLLIHIISSVLVIVPLIVGITTREWYVIQSATVGLKIGLFEHCTDDIGGCEPIQFQKLVGYSEGMCDRAAGTLQSRYAAVIALLIASIVSSAVQALFGIETWALKETRFALRGAHVAFSTLSFFLSLVAVIVFGTSMESWLFCHQKYCDLIDSSGLGCVSYAGYSQAIICCAVCIQLVALLALATNIVFCRNTEAHKLKGTPTSAKDPKSLVTDPTMVANATEMSYTHAAYSYVPKKTRVSSYLMEEIQSRESSLPPRVVQGTSEPPRSPTPKVAKPINKDVSPVRTSEPDHLAAPAQAPLPDSLADGDWTFEEANGYYWSEAKQLYYEPTSQMFYDPFSDSWYDPQTGEWAPNSE